MTDFSYLQRRADARMDEVNRLLERAKFYKKKQDQNQALTNYIDAIAAYAEFAKAREIIVELPAALASPRGQAIIYSGTLFDVANIIVGILGYYDDNSVEKAFLAEKIKIISQELAKYESELDVDRLEECEDIRIIVNSYQGLINSNQAALEEFKKKPFKELDEQFAKIRSALSDISSTKVCPVTLDSDSCFIATAAYSTSIHPDLDTFRQFRDEKLLTNSLGKQLVSLYYKIGPKMAQYVESQPKIKVVLRQHLARLAEWMRS